MSLAITESKDFDVSKISFTKMKKGKMGNKTVYLQCDNKKLYLQLPFLRSPYGLSSYTDEASGKTTWSLDLSFDAENEDAMRLKGQLEQLDDLIVNTVAQNSKEWLGKEFNVEVLKQALFKPIVRPGKDDYPATMKLKILTKLDGVFIPEAYNMKRERVALDTIEKGQKCCAICDVQSIWFIDNKFGVTIRLSQVLMEQSQRLPSFAFKGLDLPDAIAEPTSDQDEEDDFEEDMIDDE